MQQNNEEKKDSSKFLIINIVGITIGLIFGSLPFLPFYLQYFGITILIMILLQEILLGIAALFFVLLAMLSIVNYFIFKNSDLKAFISACFYGFFAPIIISLFFMSWDILF